MRHARSKANAAGIIVSRIENDRRGDYGLTEHGRRQALTAARSCGLPQDTVICSSDFSRARQTAEVVRAHLGGPEVVIAEALRERFFGHWEGSATGNYARVWAADETDPGQAGDDVEPTAAVLDRATAFITELERRYYGRDILLVSHGDTLQILQAGFLPADPSRHRSLPHLATAEIRQLQLGQTAAGSCLAALALLGLERAEAPAVIVRKRAGMIQRGGMQPDAVHHGSQRPGLLDTQGQSESAQALADEFRQQPERHYLRLIARMEIAGDHARWFALKRQQPERPVRVLGEPGDPFLLGTAGTFPFIGGADPGQDAWNER